ncbi:MAG: hypothetical protein R2789_13110 [Microthrixaceae bacterium]
MRDDYSGALVDRIATEEFSVPALVAIIEELCLQQHLLARLHGGCRQPSR